MARAYAGAVIAIAAVTAAGLLVHPYATHAEITMLYLIGIAVAALAGRGPALVASSVAVAAFDFCFVEPRYTFAVTHARSLLTFAVMFAAGLAISTLTTRLRRQQREATEAAVRARTEELRSSLLSAVSHDLRTPLAVITGAATTLAEDRGTLTSAQRTELLGSIVDDAKRLERVLGNLLQLTKLEGGLVPNREPIPVEELVGAALTRLEDAIGDRPVELDVPSDLTVSVDPVLFEQVLINLVDNALKHGAPPYAIAARATAAGTALTVRDHGTGITAGDELRVFDKFVRMSEAPGAGLGLAVVRAIVEAHGGRVSAGAATGGGAAFQVVLP